MNGFKNCMDGFFRLFSNTIPSGRSAKFVGFIFVLGNLQSSNKQQQSSKLVVGTLLLFFICVVVVCIFYLINFSFCYRQNPFNFIQSTFIFTFRVFNKYMYFKIFFKVNLNEIILYIIIFQLLFCQ